MIRRVSPLTAINFALMILGIRGKRMDDIAQLVLSAIKQSGWKIVPDEDWKRDGI
jgi:hypothetical protein